MGCEGDFPTAGFGICHVRYWKCKIKNDLCSQGANRLGHLWPPSLLLCPPCTYLELYLGFVDFHGPAWRVSRKITDSRTHRSAFYSERTSLGRLFLRKLNLPEPYLPTLQMRKPISDSLGCSEDENRQFIQQICLDPLIISVGTEKAFDKIPYAFKFKQINNLFV